MLALRATVPATPLSWKRRADEPPQITDRDGVVLESTGPDRMLVCEEGEWTLSGPYAFTWLRDDGSGFEEVDNRSTNPKRYRTHSDDSESERDLPAHCH